MYYDSLTNELWTKESKNLKRNYYKGHFTHELGRISIDNADGQKGETIILPDLSPYLICYIPLNASKKPFAKLVGPRTRSITISHMRRRFAYILRLKPGYLNFQNKFHIIDLINTSIDLSNIFPNLWEPLSTVLELKDDVQIFNQMNRVVSSLNKDENPHKLHTLNYLFYEKEIQTVKEAAKQTGISERYLRKVFNQHIGISPNNAFRIIRLSKSLEMHGAMPDKISWAWLAIDSGYYDRSHMISEYQRFVGSTPEKLFHK